MVSAINSITNANGGTSISAGMNRGLSLLEQGTNRRIMLVLSDGEQARACAWVHVSRAFS